MRIVNGSARQIDGTMIAHIEFGPRSQTGLSSSRCSQSTRNVLMIPESLTHMNCQRIAATKLGTTHGTSTSVRIVRLSGNSRLSRSAIAMPSASVEPTVQVV